MAKRGKRGKNEGSIYQDKDGRWRAAVDYGYQNGKRVRKVLSGETRSEVASKLTTALRDRQLNMPLTQERYTIGQHLEHWLTDVAEPSVRPKTYRTYSDITHQHLIPSLGKVPLVKLTPNQIRSFMKAKSDEGLSPRTVKHLRDTLRAAINVAVRDGIVVRNVATLVDPPREVQNHEPHVFTPEQARRFLDTVKGHRLEALFSVALSLGLREGEVLGLRWQDIDLNTGSLSVRRQLQRIDGKLQLVEPKTEKSRRTVTLPQVAVSAHRAHQVRQQQERQVAGDKWIASGMVFTTTIGTMLDARNLLKAFYGIMRNSDLPQLRFHDLRHSAATLLLIQGVHPKVVQELGGWSDIRIVLNTYSHVIPSLKDEAASKMNSILNPLASSLASSGDSARPN